MHLRVLGCSGGIGGQSLRTTSLQIDHDILIDAGTGVGELSMAEMEQIDHVFLTHAHLDHIACLPLLINAVADRRDNPLFVYAIEPVIDVLRKHIFNWSVWPDFSILPSADFPAVRFQPIAVGQVVILNGRMIEPLPADHTVPAVGYRLDSGAGSLVFSGDSGPCPDFWRALGRIDNLRHLIVECAFPNCEQRLAELSRHFCPSLLATVLPELPASCQLHVTHLKPGHAETTMAELAACSRGHSIRMLEYNQILAF